jgi:hypothetical protein
MIPSCQTCCVLSPKLVVYSDEKIVSPRLKLLGSLIPFKPGETRPPGEAVPKGIRKTDSFI